MSNILTVFVAEAFDFTWDICSRGGAVVLRTIQIIATFVFAVITISPLAAQSWHAPTEPDYKMVDSGRCEVNVCTDFDFGDHVFRTYAAERATTLHLIPPGACTCKRVKKAGRDFNNYLVFGIRTREGHFIPNISLSRIWPPGHPRAPRDHNTNIRSSQPREIPASRPNETTYEEFKRLEAALEPAKNFSWKDDGFETFHVLQTKYVFANGSRRYFFIPREPAYLAVRSTRQPVAFVTPLAVPLDGPNVKQDGRTVSAAFRFSESILFFQLFVPRLAHSDQWIPKLENTGRFLSTRLIPTSKR